MPDTPRYVTRVVRLPLADADGAQIGKIDDVVLAPVVGAPPRVLGFVASVQRRHIFVNANRIGSLDGTGVRMRSGNIDVRPFRKREGEILAIGDIIGTKLGADYIVDLAIVRAESRVSQWEIASVALGGRGPLARRRNPQIEPWTVAAELFSVSAEAAAVARFREMRPADVATQLRNMPLAQRQQLTDIMEDEQVADLLEELPEDEQIRIVEGLDTERAADVLEAMDKDDAADLLAELGPDDRARLLEAMDDEDATPLRRLLSYDNETAGGLMTPEPIVVSPTTTVAEALAYIRVRTVPVALAAQVFVVNLPLSVPTGRFLGAVGFQRLLREPPSTKLGELVPERPEFLDPDASQLDVAGRLAAYDLVAMAVCDSARRLVGAVTIDDVMDHVLPTGWRRRLPRAPITTASVMAAAPKAPSAPTPPDGPAAS